MRYVLIVAALVVCLTPSVARADILKLLSGAVLCKSDDGLDHWVEAVEEKDQATQTALLDSQECYYNFRAQLVEGWTRMFFRTAKVSLNGKLWYTLKENLRVPAPERGEEAK